MPDETKVPTTRTVPLTTPTHACVTAHRLEDNRVLVTSDDHELHALEQEIATESTAEEGNTDG